MGRIVLLLLKISRPPFWVTLPLVFCMGLAFGERGLTDPFFRFTPLMVLQIFLLSFPFCLFTFGLNDIHDYASDQMNPRKKGIEGGRLEIGDHRIVKTAALGVGVVFLGVSAATASLINLYFAGVMLCLSYVYSVPPWRLKTRPPFDAISAGILGFFAPFALGYSFVDDATALPLQVYCFTCCVMGFHAFSTITDYEVDRRSGDRTFAVAYGKRAAALFPAAVFFLCSLLFVRVSYIRIFLVGCLLLFSVVAAIPSERIARCSVIAMFLGAIAVLTIWIVSFVLH